MFVCKGIRGDIYNIGNAVSDDAIGAEGEICTVIGRSDIVAKIYHPQILESRASELEHRLSILQGKDVLEEKGVFSIAWPRDVLYDSETKRFVGYTMRKINAKYSLYNLIRKDNCKSDIIKQYTWKHSMQAAYNLSWFVNYLHSQGIILGDFNEKNFLFDDATAGFGLIDCGAYGIFDGQLNYPSLYTMPTYCAPERLEGIEVENPMYTDYFYLAIHIFNLLTNNANPFRAVPISNDDDGWYTAIRNGECVFVKQIEGKRLPEGSVRPGVFPKDILEAFNRTFNYNRGTIKESVTRRTTAYEWCQILNKYLKDEECFKTCKVDRRHVYLAHLSECPWCNPSSVSDLPFEYRDDKQQYKTNELENYLRAAEQGDVNAQNALAVMYYHGHGVAQDPAKAYKWAKRAADQGDALGQYNLGVLYARGEGIPQDYIKAYECYKKAAEQDYTNAQVALGNMYYYGHGVAQDYTKAFEWNKRAADQGNSLGLYNLGELYEKGEGVPQNYTKAYECYKKVVDQGDDRAKEDLERVSKAKAEQEVKDNNSENGGNYSQTNEIDPAVEDVIAKINAIKWVGHNKESQKEIRAAREAYNNLNDLQKVLVSTDRLELAEKQYEFSRKSDRESFIEIVSANLIIIVLVFAIGFLINGLMGEKKEGISSSVVTESIKDESNSNTGIHYYNYDLNQSDGDNYNVSFGPDYWSTISNMSLDSQINDASKELFSRMEHDPVMAVACLAYVDKEMGTDYTGRFYSEISANWTDNLNKISELFISDKDSWINKVGAFKELLGSHSSISIEEIKGGSIMNFLMEKGDEHPKLDTGYLGLKEYTYHYLTYSIKVKGKDFKLSFLIEFGYMPVLERY